MDALAAAYTQVFREAGLAGLGTTGVLRLSMLSANVNAGDWRDDISAVTVLGMVSDVVGEALAAAHRSYASERTCSGLVGGAAERR